MDGYYSHMDNLVTKVLQEAGCKVMILPGGCTSVLQPLDVAINKTIKSAMKEQYNEFARNCNLGEVPAHFKMAEWIINAVNSVNPDLIFNAMNLCGKKIF